LIFERNLNSWVWKGKRLGVLQIFNQCVNEKTKENKMINEKKLTEQGLNAQWGENKMLSNKDLVEIHKVNPSAQQGINAQSGENKMLSNQDRVDKSKDNKEAITPKLEKDNENASSSYAKKECASKDNQCVNEKTKENKMINEKKLTEQGINAQSGENKILSKQDYVEKSKDDKEAITTNVEKDNENLSSSYAEKDCASEVGMDLDNAQRINVESEASCISKNSTELGQTEKANDSKESSNNETNYNNEDKGNASSSHGDKVDDGIGTKKDYGSKNSTELDQTEKANDSKESSNNETNCNNEDKGNASSSNGDKVDDGIGTKKDYGDKNDDDTDANYDVWLAKVRAIPEKYFTECFEMDYLYFLSRLDKVRKEDVKHMSILQKMLVKFKKWKRKDFPSAIPEYVSVPIQALQKLFEGQQFQNEAILLSVQKIEGDGNCLYQSLAESTVVKERIPKFKSYEAMERYKYVRDVMYGFAKGNQILSFMIWKHYVPKRGDKNFKEDTEKFESWVETLKENFRWGGQAEYTLFAYAFKCHVVCLRQLKARLELVCTRDFHPKISNEIDKKRFVHMGETFVSPSNVIFIWHHNFTKPRQKLGDEENGYGNHYSFLSYKKKQKKEIYHDTYLFEYTPLPPVGVINLSSPEDAKRMTKKEDRKDTVKEL
jgi:hypothetical protein